MIKYTIEFILSDFEHKFQAVKSISNIFELLFKFLSLINELKSRKKSLVQKIKIRFRPT